MSTLLVIFPIEIDLIPLFYFYVLCQKGFFECFFFFISDRIVL